jgi:WD40 repeat protein
VQTNRRGFTSTPGKARLIQALLVFIFAAIAAQPNRLRGQNPSAGPAVRLHGVISKARLTPSLHSRLRTLRFSPDGSYIMLQDESTIYVLTRSPLAVLLFFPARLALPVRFSADSTAIVVATRELGVQRWNLAAGKIIDTKHLGSEKDCLLASLSPHGNYYACLDRHSNVVVFSVSSGEQVFAGQIGDDLGVGFRTIERFHADVFFSEPFGYYIGDLATPPLDQVATGSNLQFSPDERYLLAYSLQRGLTAVDLQQRKKISLPGPLKHAAEQRGLEFVSPSRVAFVSPTKADDSVLLSFPEGKTIDKLAIAGSASSTSDERYLITFTHGAKEAELFDLQEHKSVAAVSKDGADTFAGDVISYSLDTGVSISHLGEDHPRARGRIPLGALPRMQTALASPGLETLALGISGQGAVFNTSTGAEIASFPGLRGAWFADDQQAYLRVPAAAPLTSTFQSLDLRTGKTEDTWTREDVYIKNESLFSGPVLLSEVMREMYMMFGQHRFGYELRPLDLKTGKQLWSHDYGGNPPRTGYAGDPPVTFTDPQGDRIVLGWPATSDGAKAAAKHAPTIKQEMKQAKVVDRNSVFEVLDARTGNSIGAAFVPEGAGPESFTSAFSEGDWLILVKDGTRITALSLSTGAEQLHVTAAIPTISAEAGMLSASQEGGRLLLYDLKTGTKRDIYTFPFDVLYSRFSTDGKRLLVLTEDQMVYILDVTAVPDAAAAPSP